MRSLWDEFIHSRAFWLSYVSAGMDLAGCPSLRDDKRRLSGEPACGARLAFAFPAHHLLLFEVQNGEHAVQLYCPDLSEPIEVGTRDEGHPMSDLLRWPEFGILTRSLTREVRPGWAVELLFLSYVAVTSDCAAEHRSVLRSCLTASDVFNESEVEYLSTRASVRNDFRWVESPELGWVAEGPGACGSMRNRQAGFDFPVFRSFLAAVQHA